MPSKVLKNKNFSSRFWRHHFVFSLLCTLPNIEEEEASCLVGVVEVDVHKFDHQMVPIALVANLPTRWHHLH